MMKRILVLTWTCPWFIWMLKLATGRECRALIKPELHLYDGV